MKEKYSKDTDHQVKDSKLIQNIFGKMKKWVIEFF
jgi:hypothetical protein